MWARQLVKRVSSPEWCYRLALFDSRVLAGLPLASADVDGADGRTERRLRRDERRWRHELQAFVSGCQREGSAMTPEAVARGSYPRLPSCWAAFEVPWGIFVESPRVALIWGLTLAASPYKAEEAPRERDALAHVLWSATLSQWAKHVAGELLAEASCAWRGRESLEMWGGCGGCLVRCCRGRRTSGSSSSATGTESEQSGLLH